MKTFNRILAVVALVAATVLPSSAQFRFGVRAGMSVNKLHLSKDVANAENRTGFTGGITAEFTVPVINLGFDASVLYARRTVRLDRNLDGMEVVDKTDNRDYIDIPVNLKWKIGIPVVGKVITPFLTTGPDFSFLISSRNFGDAMKNKKFDVAWTVGAGVELLSHLQLAANYGFGLTKSVSGDAALYSGKNRCWTVTASYYF